MERSMPFSLKERACALSPPARRPVPKPDTRAPAAVIAAVHDRCGIVIGRRVVRPVVTCPSLRGHRLVLFLEHLLVDRVVALLFLGAQLRGGGRAGLARREPAQGRRWNLWVQRAA